MTIYNTLEQHTQQLISQLGPMPTIIVGLSGGPDSVFLLYLLKQLRDAGNCVLVAAHLNHGWRAEAADDAAWCKALCNELDVPFTAGHANDYPVNKKYQGSAEAIGRKQRQLFFAAVKEQHSAKAIALGHHQNDQIETFFIRLARGSSLSGLHGMEPYDGTYLRPLLNTSKQAILDYLNEHGIPYLTDATNTHDAYLRNRLRSSLIPALEQCDQRFASSIINTMGQLKAENDFLEELTLQSFNELFASPLSLGPLGRRPSTQPSLFGSLGEDGRQAPWHAIAPWATAAGGADKNNHAASPLPAHPEQSRMGKVPQDEKERNKSASLPAFLAHHVVLQRRIIMHWLIAQQVSFTPSARLIEEILRFLSSPRGGTHAISTTHRLVKQKSRIWLENTVG